MPAFVVAPEHDHFLGPGNLHGQDQQQHFDREVAPIHVVPKEDILGLLAVAPYVGLQQFQEVVELSMEISDDGDRVLDGDQVGLGFCIGEHLLNTWAACVIMRQ